MDRDDPSDCVLDIVRNVGGTRMTPIEIGGLVIIAVAALIILWGEFGEE
jgi:hypothetical protein